MMLKANNINILNIWNQSFDSLSILLFLLDNKGRIIRTNKASRRYFRKQNEQIIGKYLCQVIFNVDKKPENSILDALKITKKRKAVEVKVKNKWLKIIIDPILDKNKTLKNMVVVVSDITERKNTINELELREKKFKDLVELANIAIGTDDCNGNIVYFNKQFSDMFGYTADEMKMLSHKDLVHPDDIEKISRIHQNRIHGDNSVSCYEFRGLKKNGEIVFIHISVNEIIEENGRILGTRSYLRNTTTQKKAEENINILAHTVESINELVSITDFNNEFIYVNKAFLNTYGYTYDEIKGKTPDILRPDNSSSELTELIHSETLKGVWIGEVINKKKDGTLFPVELSTSVIRDNDNKTIALVGIGRDITERKTFIDKLENALKKARESDQLKTAFLSNISHEIRTPLNGILGFSKLIIKENISLKDKKQYATIIDKSSTKLLNIIKDILDISSIESGNLKLYNKRFNLNELVSSIFDQYKIDFKNKNIKFELKCSKSKVLQEIYTDRDKLEQIIEKLLSNALKFTEEGHVEFGFKKVKNFVEFYVSDTGIGIEKHLHAKIFDHFRQVETDYTRKYDGNGLGLSIAKGLVEALGGKIWLKSVVNTPPKKQIGGGTTFYFKIPLNKKL